MQSPHTVTGSLCSVPSLAAFGNGTQDTEESCRKGTAQPCPAGLEAIPHQMLISISLCSLIKARLSHNSLEQGSPH